MVIYKDYNEIYMSDNAIFYEAVGQDETYIITIIRFPSR